MSVDPRVAELDAVIKQRNHPRAGWKFTEAWDTWLRGAACRGIESEATEQRGAAAQPSTLATATPVNVTGNAPSASDLSSPEAVREAAAKIVEGHYWDSLNYDSVGQAHGKSIAAAIRALPLAPLDAQTQQAVELAKEVIDATPRDYARYKLARALLKVTGG